jgi:tetratricopeptide (TPR) repeat protein
MGGPQFVVGALRRPQSGATVTPTPSGSQPTGGRGRGRTGGRAAGGPRKDHSNPGRGSGRTGRAPERAPATLDRSKDRSRSTAGRWRRDELPAEARTAVQAEYDGPPIPEGITGKEVDRQVSNALKSLPEKLATRVARHLVAAGRLMDSDPDTAYQHTVAARARAARVAIVREACGEAAYASGRFKEALTEFKAARRMNGSSIYLPMMADSERAVGRPERAIALAKDPGVVDLDEAGQIELKIVESGARRDLGDHAAAIRTLAGRELRSRSRESWVPRLRYAYAEALLADGQRTAALEWFERAAGIDAEGYTDAAERVAELEGLVVVDTVDDHDDDVDHSDAD